MVSGPRKILVTLNAFSKVAFQTSEYMLITMGLLILAGNTWYTALITMAYPFSFNQQLSHISSTHHLDTASFSSRQ